MSRGILENAVEIDAASRASGARIRTASRVSTAVESKPTLFIVGDSSIEDLVANLDTTAFQVIWITSWKEAYLELGTKQFDIAVIQSSFLTADAINRVIPTTITTQVKQLVFIGKPPAAIQLPPTNNRPLVLSNACPIADHRDAIQGISELVRRSHLTEQVTESANSDLLSPMSVESVLYHLVDMFADVSMSAQPAISALEDLSQKDSWALSHTTTISLAWKRINDCLRDVSTLLGFPGDYRPTQTIRVLESIVDDHIEHLAPNQRFISRIASSLRPVQTSEDDLRLLCKKLLENAQIATRRGGEVLLQADDVTINHAFTGSTFILPGEYVRIRVCDNGIGMDEETLQHSKDPFFSTWGDAACWSGLGLSQADAICRRALGTLTLRSKLGLGTIVTAWLPKSLEYTNPQATQPTNSPLLATKFLLVDRDTNILSSLSKSLRQLGHSVFLAQDAATALSVLDEEPDCMFAVIDLHVERDSGFMLAQSMAERFPNLQIAVCSGIVNRDVSITLNRPNDSSVVYLRKPFNVCELLAKFNLAAHSNCED
jgi:signal transduction histidine kinase/ActR/RegA family two-component response regulator